MTGVWLGSWPDRWRARRRRGKSRAGHPQYGGDPYNRGVNASMTPAADARNLSLSVPLPAGLTVADATRIAEAMSAAHAESTRDLYAHAWRVWERWCAARDATPIPASPAMVCAYLTERADQGVSVGTLDLACSAIAYQHRRHGLENPILSEGVRQVRRGLRRIVGTAPRRQARPLGVAEIRRILGAIDRETAKGARDAAIILIGLASALRRSKSDQDGTGQIVGVAHGQHAVTDPVASLATWFDFRGTAPGPLFTSMRHQSVTLEPLSGDAIARMLRTRARAAGLAAERITAHSLRAGHATTAAVAGVSLDRIAAQTRHRRLSTLVERYIRPAQALQLTSSCDLGL